MKIKSCFWQSRLFFVFFFSLIFLGRISFAQVGAAYKIPENETNAKVISLPDGVKIPEGAAGANVKPETSDNFQSMSVASLSNNYFTGFYRYPAEERYWLQMINDEAYFRDVLGGGQAYIEAENDGDTWTAAITKPDGTTILGSPVRFYAKWWFYENCFVAGLALNPAWAICDARALYVTWYAKTQCMQSGDWTMEFYYNGSEFHSGNFALLPEINPEKASKPWVTLLNQGFYGDDYDSICKGPINPETGRPTSVPCDETYSTPWIISEKGCYLTSAAMILNYHGVDTEPTELNAWLTDNSGYNKYGDVKPTAVAKFAANIKGKKVSFLGRKSEGALENFMCAYGPQMTGVKIRPNGTPGHWVTATGRDKEKTTFKINDPAGGQTTTISARYNNQYAQVRAFGGPEHTYTDESGIRIDFYSPVKPVLTDPQGRRAGFDPIKKITYDEIPTGGYDEYYIEDALTGDPGPLMQVIDIRQPLEGNYTLDVIGIDTGTYGMEIEATDVKNHISGRMEFEDVPIIPGQVYSYGFSFAKAVGSELKVFGAYDGGGQRPKDVNKFLSYINPSKSQTELTSWPIAFNLMIFYDKNIIVSTFKAELNGVDISSMFKPTPGLLETVNINLNHGRNVLLLSVEGNLANRVAKDTDRLVFLAP